MTTIAMNTHARRPLPAPAEAALWFVWVTARFTGAGAIIGALRGALRRLPWHLAGQLDLPLARVRDAVDRGLIRVQLEVAALRGHGLTLAGLVAVTLGDLVYLILA